MVENSTLKLHQKFYETRSGIVASNTPGHTFCQKLFLSSPLPTTTEVWRNKEAIKDLRYRCLHFKYMTFNNSTRHVKQASTASHENLHEH